MERWTRRPSVAVAALAILAAALGACSSSGPPGNAAGSTPDGAARPTSDGEWHISPLALAESAAASPSGGGAAGSPVAVTKAWQDGDVTTVVVGGTVLSSTDLTTWTPAKVDDQGGAPGSEQGGASPESTSRPPAGASGADRRIVDVLRDGDRTVLVGSTLGTFRPLVLVSVDHGRTWRSVHSPDLEVAADLSSVVRFSDRLVAFGALRPHGSSGPFAPAAWTSTDHGDTWTRLPLDAAAIGAEGSLGSAAVIGGSLLVAGTAGYQGRLLRTTDLTSWTPVELPLADGATMHLEQGAGHVVAAASEASVRVTGPFGAVTDDGEHWEAIPDDPITFGDTPESSTFGGSSAGSRAVTVQGDDHGFVATGSGGVRSDPQFCFQDFASCQARVSFVATSTDGRVWHRVATEETPSGQAGIRFLQVVDGRDPLTVLVSAPVPAGTSSTTTRPGASGGADRYESQVWQWSVPGSWPAPIAFPTPSTTTPAAPMLASRDASLPVGERARVAWATGGCGSGGFTIDGRYFTVDPPGLGSPGPGWAARRLQIADGPSLLVFGTLERTGDDELTFTVEGSDTTVHLHPGTAGPGCW